MPRVPATHLLEQDDGAALPLAANRNRYRGCRPGQRARCTSSSKPRDVVGREGADIALQDPEISRHHCVIEVRDTYVNLRDLDSTNGTFYEEERVRAAMLQNDAEFRIGETVLRISFVPN